MYVRKSAHERKQMIKQMGQIFNNRRIWVKVTWCSMYYSHSCMYKFEIISK